LPIEYFVDGELWRCKEEFSKCKCVVIMLDIIKYFSSSMPEVEEVESARVVGL